MDRKLCVLYNKNKTQDKAVSAINECKEILLTQYYSYTVLQKLCGAISYNSLFLIEDHRLTNGSSYTVENVCHFSAGLLKESTHLFLSNCMELTVNPSNIYECLHPILEDCLFGEVLAQFKLNAKDIYCMLSISYYSELSKFTNLNKVLDMWKDDIYNLEKIQYYVTSNL